MVKHPLTVPPYLVHDILSMRYPRLKHLLHAACFSHNVAKVGYTCSRCQHLAKMSTPNQHSFLKRRYMVLLAQVDNPRTIRRQLTSFYPFFIHGILKFFHSMSSITSKHKWFQGVTKPPVNMLNMNGLWCLPLFDPCTYSYVKLYPLLNGRPRTQTWSALGARE